MFYQYTDRFYKKKNDNFFIAYNLIVEKDF